MFVQCCAQCLWGWHNIVLTYLWYWLLLLAVVPVEIACSSYTTLGDPQEQQSFPAWPGSEELFRSALNIYLCMYGDNNIAENRDDPRPAPHKPYTTPLPRPLHPRGVEQGLAGGQLAARSASGQPERHCALRFRWPWRYAFTFMSPDTPEISARCWFKVGTLVPALNQHRLFFLLC